MLLAAHIQDRLDANLRVLAAYIDLLKRDASHGPQSFLWSDTNDPDHMYTKPVTIYIKARLIATAKEAGMRVRETKDGFIVSPPRFDR